MIASPQCRFRFARQDHCSSATTFGLNFRMRRYSFPNQPAAKRHSGKWAWKSPFIWWQTPRPSPRGFECAEPTGSGRPLLPREHGRQKPEFGLHFRGIGNGVCDFLAKDFAIAPAKPVNGNLERPL
jgi:hypothetical protein